LFKIKKATRTEPAHKIGGENDKDSADTKLIKKIIQEIRAN